MNQQMHQNAAIMAQLQRPRLIDGPSNASFHKYSISSAPPFLKWYGTPTPKLLLMAQVDSYKAEAYYAGIPDWSQTTSTTKQLSVTISADM